MLVTVAMQDFIIRFLEKGKKNENEKVFVALEKRWNRQGYTVYFSAENKGKALKYIKYHPFYLKMFTVVK